MTTNATLLIGQLISGRIDILPDDQVVASLRPFIHNVLDNGYMTNYFYSAEEKLVWEIVDALGHNRTGNDVWVAEENIFRVLNDYDLFVG